jgi:hypothetical protein
MMSSMIDSMMGDTDLHVVVMRNGHPVEYVELSNHFDSTPENVLSINERWQLIKYLRQFRNSSDVEFAPETFRKQTYYFGN